MKRTYSLSLILPCVITLVSCSTADHTFHAGGNRGNLPSAATGLPLWGGANGVVAGKAFMTRKELLTAINTWMRQNNLPELTMDDLVIRSAIEVSSRNPDPLAEQFLEELAKDHPFKDPVGLWTEWNGFVSLTEAHSTNKQLDLPGNHLLSIRLYTGPWGSTDGNGIRNRVDTHDVPIAYALVKRKN